MDAAAEIRDSLSIAPVEVSDAHVLVDYLTCNRDFLRDLEPLRADAYFTIEEQTNGIRRAQTRWGEGIGYAFGLFVAGTLVGRLALSNVVRGAGQYASIGYSVDQRHNGKGYATQAVQLAVSFAFGDAGLHRIQGAVIPESPASARVLIKAGFRREGYFLRYLRIGGQWADHDIYAITEEDVNGAAGSDGDT